MSENPPYILELKNITKTFYVSKGLFKANTPLHALSGVSLQLAKGEVIGLVGESGCGKSTLANILLGLLKPTSGEVLFDGQPMAGHDRKYRASRIQPIFQDPYSSLNPRKSIEDIILLPLKIHQTNKSADWDKKLTKILDLVGLPRRVRQSYPSQMSGGQRQRVAIARALILKPEVVICDEPTSALDVSVQSQILNLLLDLRDELGLTYLFISHNLAVVEHLASKVCVMYLGQIVEEARTARIFDESRHPYTQALLESILTPDPSKGVPDTHLGTSYPNPIEPPSGCTFHPRCEKALPICSQSQPENKKVGLGLVRCHLWNNNNPAQ